MYTSANLSGFVGIAIVWPLIAGAGEVGLVSPGDGEAEDMFQAGFKLELNGLRRCRGSLGIELTVERTLNMRK